MGAERDATSADLSAKGVALPEAAEETASGGSRFGEWLEFIPSALMALAVVLTAYSAYESTRWSGVQATNFATAGALGTQASTLITEGVTQLSYDANLFGELLLAFREANLSDPAVQAEAIAFAETLFRDEAKPALEEWLALNPLINETAPDTPFDLPSYRNANLEEADRLKAEAEQRFQDARNANQNGDNYVLATILFASVLFFSGLRIKSSRLHAVVLAFATLFLIGGVIWLLTLPFQ